MSGQSGGQRLRLSTLNDALTCKLCGGYFIDATTIIECLHSFCKSCIVKYLENNKNCPVCNVQVHKSKPLLNIRSDQMLQDVVYKLVPGCYQNEMRKRKEFYDKRPQDKSKVTSSEARGEPDDSYIYSPDESLSLSLEYYTPENEDDIENDKEAASKHLPKRYLRCPAAVTVFHLQKLIRAKYGLSDAHRVDIMYKEEPLSANYTLMDIMYIYHWRTKVPLHLSYRIFESASKRLKLSDDNDDFKQSLSNSNIELESKDSEQLTKWKEIQLKEVQLKISEAGVMEVRDKDGKNLDMKNSTKGKAANQQSGLDQTASNATSVNKTAVKEEKDTAKGTATPKSKKAQQEANKKNEQNSDAKSNATSAPKSEEMEVKSIDQRDLSNEILKSENEKKQSNTSANKTQTQQAQDKVKTEPASTPEKSEVKPNSTATSNNIEAKSEAAAAATKQNAKSTPSAGSKINALSAKLQFQPKVGQVNNTYAKKSPAADKKAGSPTKVVVDVKAQQKATPKVEIKSEEPTEVKPVVVSTTTPSYSRSSLAGTATAPTYVTAPSDTSIKIPQPNDVLHHSLGAPSTESLASIGMHVSTTTTTATTATTMPQQGQVNVNWLLERNNAALKSSKALSADQQLRSMPGMPHIGRDIVCSTTTVTTPSTLGRFSIQTPSMSIYSITTSKNNYSSPPPPKQPSPKQQQQQQQQSGLDVTSMFPVPPCPDGIPISLMKSLNARKDLPKSSPLDKNARQQSAGSKINDIIAKIGESSKEKSKIEAQQRGKPEVPDLLKISKSSTASESSGGSSSPVKHIPNIPNVPIYTPSNSQAVALSNEAKKLAASGMTPAMISSQLQKLQQQQQQQQQQPQKKQLAPVPYKTLRDPPKPWNPTLSKNNYVAAKNAKELQNQTQAAYGVSDGGGGASKIPSKPAKIFKIKNMPRYLGNPASGVKPMYSVSNEQAKEKDQSSGSKNSPTMMKIDPQTLSPIVSSPNSPIVSPPPYSPTARSYQNSPFSPRDIRNSSSPISPRNSPVNMLSTNPFIPSHTPNTNPRLIYSHFPPAHFPDATRFNSNPLIRSPIGIPTVTPSAFHSSLPPAINKLYHQRTGYLAPQTSSSASASAAPAVQRVPPSSPSSKAKSPTASVVDSVAMQLAKGLAHNAFDLTRAEAGKQATQQPTHKSTSDTAKPKSSPNAAKKTSADALVKQQQNDKSEAKASETESKTTTAPAAAAPAKVKETEKTEKSSAQVNGGTAETTASSEKPKGGGESAQPSKEKSQAESKTTAESTESKKDVSKNAAAAKEGERIDAKKATETQDNKKQEIKIDNSEKKGDSPAKAAAESQKGKIES